MKILYVTASPVPSLAANSVHVVKMVQAIKNIGHNITLLSPFYKNNVSPNSLDSIVSVYGVTGDFERKVFHVPDIKGGVLFHAFRVALFAKLSGVDLVFSRCLICAWAATCLGLNTVFERHDVVKGQSPKVQKIFEKLVKSSRLLKIVVISHALKQHFKENYDISDEMLLVAADGADPIAPERLAGYKRTSDRPVAGYIGHLYKGRGIDVIASMARKMPLVDFHIVGGAAEDLMFWKEATSDIQNIVFYGHVKHSETPDFLKTFDFLLAPYQRKVLVSGGEDTVQWMSPLKIFEYMSSGKPILCSDLPVLHEVLSNKENAILCSPDSVDDWVAGLSTLISDKELANKIAANALSDFLSRYTWRSRAEFILNSVC